MKKASYSLMFALAVLALVGVGTAAAATYWGGPSLALEQGPPASQCFWARAMARAPGATGYQIDLNAYGYKEIRDGSGCTFTAPWRAYTSNEQQLQAFLYERTSWVVCSQTSVKTIPSGSSGSGYGWGKGYNRSGACAGKTAFEVVAATNVYSAGWSYSAILYFNL